MVFPLLFFIGTTIVIDACADHGLSPVIETETPGFGGTITIRSTWPPQDSIRDLRIAAFRNYPPKDILSEIIQGSAVFSDELPYGEEAIEYRVQSASMGGTYAYVVVAQNYGPDPFQQWRAVGVYAVTGDVASPTGIDLGAGKFIRGINVDVDFINLPPQPF
jgi:hypothetical protein